MTTRTRAALIACRMLALALCGWSLSGASAFADDQPPPLPPIEALITDLGSAARWAIVRENLRRYAVGVAMLSEVALEKGC